MKIGRNSPCPCGSRIKYKKCCLRKTEDQKLIEALVDSTSTLNKDGHIKQCLHPNHNECSGGIIKAHAIQNNRILNRIAENGNLIMLDGTSNLFFQGAQQKGRKVTTMFTGFCSYHDKALFQEIEDRPFICSEKQIFLLTYRTMAWHYHKKQEQVNRQDILMQRMHNKGFDYPLTEDSLGYLDSLALGLSDNQKKKTVFDAALLDQNYQAVQSVVWEIPYEVQFTISMQYEPTYDLQGNVIGDYANDEYLRSIFLNIFPVDGKTLCIWSWLAEDAEIIAPFAKQFMALPDNDRMNYLNNNLPIWSDALVISPKLWTRWGKDIQQALIAHANMDKLYFAFEMEDGGHPYEYMDTPWNLFEP